MWPISNTKSVFESLVISVRRKVCPLGHLGTFGPLDVLSVGRFVCRTFCPEGRCVPWDVLSLGRIVPWDVLSAHQNYSPRTPVCVHFGTYKRNRAEFS